MADEEANELLARLQNQFGDIDINNLLQGESSGVGQKGGEESEESSVVEPTPEELQAWQDAQFQKGKEKRDMEERKKLSPLHRRHHEKQKGDDDGDDWEEVLGPPDLNGQTSVFFPQGSTDEGEFLGVHPQLQELATGDPEILGTKWRRLYSSLDGDGLSFHNLWDVLKGYTGPTVLLIGTVPSLAHALPSDAKTEGSQEAPSSSELSTTIGFYTTDPWGDSKVKSSENHSFLFSVCSDHRNVRFFRPKQAVKDVHYTHFKSSTSRNGYQSSDSKTDGALHGIGVGGTPSQPRLHLTETLEACRALPYCSQFEDGDLLPPATFSNTLYYFDVDAIEVWGVGGNEWIQEALESRQRERDLHETKLRQIRTIKDKSVLLDDFRSGLFRTSNAATGAFSHVDQVAGRASLGNK